MVAPFSLICAGQTGAAMAALCAARVFHIATGGIAPKGWRTAGGSAPELATYCLVEAQSPESGPALEANVTASDMTWVFRTAADADTELVRATCEAKGIPCHINPNVEEISALLAGGRPLRVHVAGGSETDSPGIGWRIYVHLGNAFKSCGLTPDRRMQGDANPLLRHLPKPVQESQEGA